MVTLTAVVATAATGIPTGTVTFMIDGQAQAPVEFDRSGRLGSSNLHDLDADAGHRRHRRHL